MEAAVARLWIGGETVRFERATFVEFMGWRLVLTGAAVHDTGVESEVPVELAVSGEHFLGSVRTTARPDSAAKPRPGARTVLRGVGGLQRSRDLLPKIIR